MIPLDPPKNIVLNRFLRKRLRTIFTKFQDKSQLLKK